MAEDLAPRISSLLTDLGPSPQQNIHAIVSKTCELLSCDGAVYACFEAGSDTLCIRSACNLPHHPLPARSPIHDLFREVIANGGAGPVCAVNPADRNNKSGASAGPWLGFKSFIGQQVQIGDLSPGALAALDMRRRDFTDPERLLIGLAARALAIEEGRLQREQALERRILFEKTLKDMSTMAIAVDDTLPFVRRCLEMAGTLLATGGAFLWKFDPRKNKLGLTAEWVAAGRPSRKKQLRTIAGDVLAESLGCLMNGDILNITDVSTLPAGREREMAEGLGRRAVLVVPLFSRERFFGFVGFKEDDRPRRWVEEDISHPADDGRDRHAGHRESAAARGAAQPPAETGAGRRGEDESAAQGRHALHHGDRVAQMHDRNAHRAGGRACGKEQDLRRAEHHPCRAAEAARKRSRRSRGADGRATSGTCSTRP